MWLIMLQFWTNFHKNFDIDFFYTKKTSTYLLSTQNCQRTCLTSPWHKCSYSSQKWVCWNWRLYKLGVFVMWWRYKGQSPQCMTSQQLQLGCCHEFALVISDASKVWHVLEFIILIIANLCAKICIRVSSLFLGVPTNTPYPSMILAWVGEMCFY
jgi:hypothetical protein